MLLVPLDIGSSYLPSEIIAAFLYAQFEHAEKIIFTRRGHFQQYFKNLKPLEDEGFIRLPFVEKGHIANGHIFYMITSSLDERSQLIDFLSSKGILAIFHYIPLHTSVAGRKYGRTSGPMEVTETLCDRVVRLPLFYEMDDVEIVKVISEIINFYKTHK